jgi:hypothetical protein
MRFELNGSLERVAILIVEAVVEAAIAGSQNTKIQ